MHSHCFLLPVASILVGTLAAPAPQSSASPDWSTAQCTTPEVTDASIDQTQRWNSVDTETAWKAALDDWKAKGSSGLTFTQEVSNFFHGPEQVCILAGGRPDASSWDHRHCGCLVYRKQYLLWHLAQDDLY